MLFIKAELENVDSITLKTNENLCITVKNPLSDFETREQVVLNPSQLIEPEESSKSAAVHLSLTWQGSKKPSVLTVLTAEQVKTALKKKKKVELPEPTYRKNGEFAPILAVECRGLEPTAYFPGDEFVVTSEGGAVFDSDVDFSEGDWADYDADNDQAVSISDIEFKWHAV